MGMSRTPLDPGLAGAALIAVSLALSSGCATPHEGADLIVIGNSGPLRAVEDKDRPSSYASYVSVPGVLRSRVPVLVPDALARATLSHPGAEPAMPVGGGDLVAAKADGHGMLWLERVLCGDDASYRACAEKYQPGIFDANTGRELTRHHQAKPDGALIDVSSYVKLSQESGHHSASELDPRAETLCDCNRALPGSAQSAVHVPEVDR
jgi:hypothetical protein